MPTPVQIMEEANDVIRYLVEVGLAGDQNFAFRRDLPDEYTEVTFPHSHHINIALKNRDYAEIYAVLAQARAYNAILPDGAILQMMYKFVGEDLEQHRLAFFPAPHLADFQSNAEAYLEDEIYADVVAQRNVRFPLRFDFDCRDGICIPLSHPKSHLSLGQYENCRIPLSSAITPIGFVDFVLRNFYHTAFHSFATKLPKYARAFAESIFAEELQVVHVRVPTPAN